MLAVEAENDDNEEDNDNNGDDNNGNSDNDNDEVQLVGDTSKEEENDSDAAIESACYASKRRNGIAVAPP